MDEKSEMLITWGSADRVQVFRQEVNADGIKASTSPLRVELDERFELKGSPPRYDMIFKLPEEGAEIAFDLEAGWPIWWSHWGRLLSYVGQHSSVRVSPSAGRAERNLVGLGVVEHVYGASLPFQFTRYTPVHYHWDVLRFDGGNPLDSAAGLSVGIRGKTVLRLKAAARLPGLPQKAVSGLEIKYLDISSTKGPDGRSVMLPVRWEGSMSGSWGNLSYEARSTTPPALVIPSGGMLGFEFEGELTSPVEESARVYGTGFTEYGDLSGKLKEFIARSTQTGVDQS
ncbi:MAG: hypothetical protein PHP64_05010 [Actinomycetota bacterium]|nr:hypothetical protein [Actinomycetota bacterium]